MSFEKGSVSCRFFTMPLGQALPDGAIQLFSENALPPIENMPPEGCSGWTTGRHLLDRCISEETVKIGGNLRLTLVKVSRKIPAALFKAECKQEEMAEMAAKGVSFLKRFERKEIANSVRQRLLPTMPPSLSGTDVLHTENFVCATATSDSSCDNLTNAWKGAVGKLLIPYSPEVAALKVANVDVRTLTPTSFSPDINNVESEQDIGTEFLTWLWYFSEACGGLNDGFGFMVEGPFTLVHEGRGAHEIVIRKGNPGIAQEAKSALLAGKKLKKAKLTIGRGDDLYSCTINGTEWTFGSLKLPKCESMSLPERVDLLNNFFSALEGIYKVFLGKRKDPTAWNTEVEAIRKWVANRASQA